MYCEREESPEKAETCKFKDFQTNAENGTSVYIELQNRMNSFETKLSAYGSLKFRLEVQEASSDMLGSEVQIMKVENFEIEKTDQENFNAIITNLVSDYLEHLKQGN